LQDKLGSFFAMAQIMQFLTLFAFIYFTKYPKNVMGLLTAQAIFSFDIIN